MEIKRKTVKGVTTLSVSGEVTIYTAAQFYESIFQDNKTLADQIALDLSGVSELDTAGVQLLLFSKKIFSEENKALFIAKTNEVVDGVLAMFNVTFFLKEGEV